MGKTAFVLAGGGAKGSFQVGVLKQFNERGLKPDFVYGTSVGALNAIGWSYLGIAGLEKFWLDLERNSDIIRFQLLSLLFMTKGIYSTKPLRRLVEKLIEEKSLDFSTPVVCMTNISTGEIAYVRPDTVHKHAMSFVDAVIASSSQPLYMEPIYDYWVDGGVREITPLKQAIKDGCDTIHVVLCEPYVNNPVIKTKFNNWLCYGVRTVTLLLHEVFLNDIATCVRYNDEPGRREIDIHVYAPDKILIDTLEFNPKKIRAGIAQGERAQEIEKLLEY